MSKYVRVMDGLKSNASGEEFKLDEIITAKTWNPEEKEPEKWAVLIFLQKIKF